MSGKWLVFGALALVLTAIPLLGSGSAEADIGALNIRAQIDGRSRLTIRENSAQWHHFDFAAPGRHSVNCSNPATFLPTALNGSNWFPSWPDEPDCENVNCDCDSSVFAGIEPPLAHSPAVELSAVQCRGSCSIVQFPNPQNDFAVVIEFDDNAFGGSTTYEVELRYTFTPTPIPTSVRELANVGGAVGAIAAAAADQARENRAEAGQAGAPAATPVISAPSRGTGVTIQPPSTGDGGLSSRGHSRYGLVSLGTGFVLASSAGIVLRFRRG